MERFRLVKRSSSWPRRDCFVLVARRYSVSMRVVWGRVFAGSLIGLMLMVHVAGWAQQSAPPKPASGQSATPTATDPLVHRLILKDGSYQTVSKYEIRKDRVRYISAERGGDWEELPLDLIDWAATQAYAKQHANDPIFAHDPAHEETNQTAAEIDAEEKADRSRNLEVAKDLRLPDETGIWALDYFHDAPELVELEQNSGDVNERSGHNLLRSMLNGAGATKQTIQLNERHAKPALHEPQPVIYVSIDEDSDEPGPEAITVDTHGASGASKTIERSVASSRYIIVRATVKKDFRVVGSVKIGPDGNAVPAEDVTLTKAELLPGKRWLKLTPKDPLPAGDYVLMEILSAKDVNASVWDFRIDQGAGDNENAILPIQRYIISH